MSQPSSGFSCPSSGRPGCGTKWISCGASDDVTGLERFSLLCELRDSWELLFGVKLWQLPGPGECKRCTLLGTGLAAVLCQVIFQADACSQAFPPLELPLTFFGAVFSPPQQTPCCFSLMLWPMNRKKPSGYFCSDFIFIFFPISVYT